MRRHGLKDQKSGSPTGKLRLVMWIGISASLGVIIGNLALRFIEYILGIPIDLRLSIISGLITSILSYKFRKRLIPALVTFRDTRLKRKTARVLVLTYAYVLGLYIISTIIVSIIPFQVYPTLITLASIILAASYLIKFVDSEIVVLPTRLITHILSAIFILISVLPLFAVCLFSKWLEQIFLFDTNIYFPTFLYLYGFASLFILNDDPERLRKENPWMFVELPHRAFYNIVAAFMIFGSFFLEYATLATALEVKILSVMLVIIVVFNPYTRMLVGYYTWLKKQRKTKEGRKFMRKAMDDTWYERIANISRFVSMLGSLLFALAVFLLYLSVVFLYQMFVSFSKEKLFLALLLGGAGYATASYGLRRLGLTFKLLKTLRYSLKRKRLDAENLKKRLEIQASIFAATIFGGLVAAAQLIISLNVKRKINLLGVELTDLSLLYIDIVIVFFLLIVNLFYRFTAFEENMTYSEQYLRSVRRVAEVTFSIYFILLAGVTGSIAFAMGVPLEVDAFLVVGCLLAFTVVQIYLAYIKGREIKRKIKGR